MKKYWSLIAIITCFLLCLGTLLIYYSYFKNAEISTKTETWGAFGGYISGALGTVLSFFSILLIYATYKNQLATSTLQQFEATFFSLLQNQREILKSLKGDFKLFIGTHTPRIYEAEDFVDAMANIIDSNFDNQPFDLNNRQTPETILSKSDDETYESIDSVFENIHRAFRKQIGHYFRHLYHIVKYVDESQIINKKKYSDIIQSQMSDNELYVTMYNCISRHGTDKFRPLLDKYNFFDNIDSKGVVFDKHKKMYFPNTKFKTNTTARPNTPLGEL